ncbi:hypothetical protein HR13_02385 [Porphyromonas gulae]|uniref:TaqI-like C-terminal specificity domain-containing protein n=1 Tax=Porphyromonas gulae TaxID=111105 RepID=UPI00052D90A8|nr:TaqI-like C-terminal specificity domain-containing protein [Porphyromonas gulae]KGN81062.1 hypothetical protein HR13_02385 [Porphyromonas gulae]
MRGRDIKKYGYDFANLYLIATFPSCHYDIEQFPAVKQYLLSVGKKRLEQTGQLYMVNGEKIKSRKKTSNKWFETQDSISYWEDFEKPKIIYPDICNGMSFCLDFDQYYLSNTGYFITTKDEATLQYLTHTLNSEIIEWYYRTLSVQLGTQAVRMFSIYVLNIPIPPVNKEDLSDVLNLSQKEREFIFHTKV